MNASLALPLLMLAQSAAAVPEPAGDYPWAEVLDAFATACSGVENPAVNRASALAAGWSEYAPEPASPLGVIIAYGKQMIAEENLQDEDLPIEMLENGVFKQDVAGRSLHLILSGARVDSITTYGCRIYDLDATQEPPADMLEQWTVRPANDVQRPTQGMVKYVWNPGMKPGHYEMDINYVQPGAKLPIPVPLSGLVLTASAMEFDDL